MQFVADLLANLLLGSGYYYNMHVATIASRGEELGALLLKSLLISPLADGNIILVHQ
jgi:hypothetical protein